VFRLKPASEPAPLGVAARRDRIVFPERQESDMDDDAPVKALSLEQRMAVFLALVEAQDRQAGVAESRREVAERFGLSEAQVRRIEREGLNARWPPL
jgi:hypothetical protein